MKKAIYLLLVVIQFSVSCSKETEQDNEGIKTGTGTIWLSGGLFFCAEQIHMENGDTLIPINNMELYRFKAGQKVSLKYSEIHNHESGCNIGKDCEIIEINLKE